MSDAPLLEVESLRLSVRTDEGLAQIIDHAALSVRARQIVGLVGESGCGKSTLARAILGILPGGANVETGAIWFAGENLLALSEAALARRVRGRRIGFIPQDPYLALNPVFKIGTQLLAPLRWHAEPGGGDADAPRARLIDMLRRVHIADPEAALQRYPHQFSGGQRQRLLIAGVLAGGPALVVADEPTSALDVTTQLQILDLLKSLVQELSIAMLLVTHDLGLVAELCDEVTVMYAGQTLEAGSVRQVLGDPQHPYTRALLACHPDRTRELAGIPGRVPSPLEPPPGCRFAPRCAEARDSCRARQPHLVAVGPWHRVSCRLADARSTSP
jgi:oligopeptide/dipeptide ABC transporter ATP-binding protein